jgi:hypothetical protein
VGEEVVEEEEVGEEVVEAEEVGEEEEELGGVLVVLVVCWTSK